MQCKVAASITDFPVQTSVEYFFSKFKEAGVDSVEIVIGIKTLDIFRLFTLSQKYNVPITSFHQSPWSGFGFLLDESFIKQVKHMGVTTFTFHPLTFTSFDSARMKRYFEKLAKIQEKYDVTICLENMKNESFYKKLHLFPYDTMAKHLEKLNTIAEEYNLSLTYDVSHTLFTHPQETQIFRNIFNKIKNIHLSSFHGNQEHLPLDKGDFDTKPFLEFLEKEKYKGLLTFEINYSLSKRLFTPYDFDEISRSVAIVKSLSDR